MARNKTAPKDIATLQPDEIGELKKVVQKFISEIEYIDGQIEGLKTDRKDVIDSYTDKLDIKTLNTALRIVKLKSKCDYKDTLDLFIETLTEV